MTGEGNVVLSYTTSPAYHAIMEQDDNYDVMLFEEGHTMQVEVLGVLKSAPNKKIAKDFMKFALSLDFQNEIPYGNWMYPVVDLSRLYKTDPGSEPWLPDNIIKFYDNAPFPKPLSKVYGTIEDKNTWINNWLESIE